MQNNKNPLIVMFGNPTIGNSTDIPQGRAITLVDSTPSTPWKTTRYKSKWLDIPNNVLKGMNFFFTLNPDDNIDYYENTKKWLVPKVLLLFDELKGIGLIKKSIIVYETGKKGKIHFHGFLKTKERHIVYDKICELFNKRKNLRHRTLQMDHIRTVQDRTKMIKYCQKEQHNQDKILYWN